MPSVDRAAFDPRAIEPETHALNAEIAAKVAAAGDMWAFAPDVIRDSRRQGRGIFPLPPKSARAVVETIAGPGGPLALRIIAPERPRGIYLHIHGGGWMLGQSDFQDNALERLATRSGLACVSVEYRLAPEHPFPAGPDDCEAAALWLVGAGLERFGTATLFIGGESAGANLAVLTMLRLRDRAGIAPFTGANLIAGCYDLSMTPSARRWGRRGLILDTRDIELFARAYVQNGQDLRDPAISPLYADLAGMPPALFSVGTMEALIDDSLFMAARWESAGSEASLAIWPGGVHVFQGFDFPMARRAAAGEEAFFHALLSQTSGE